MKHTNKIIAASIAVGLSISLAANTALAKSNDNSSLNAAQKKEVEQVVHDYLLNNPEILIAMSQNLEKKRVEQAKKYEQKAQETIPKIADKIFQDPNSPVAGNPNGKVTIVEFFDYQCPHCKDMTQLVDGLISKDKDLRVVFKELPIAGGRNSLYAAQAALAAKKQGKYYEFHDLLMQQDNPLTRDKVMSIVQKLGLNQEKLEKDMESKAVQDELKENLNIAQQLGIIGTPAFIIGDSKNAHDKKNPSFLVPGATSEQVLNNLIQQVKQSS